MGIWIQICPKCNREYKQFSAHLDKIHAENRNEIISILPDKMCKCGCGQIIKRNSYVSGHNLKEISQLRIKPILLKDCLCGCGKTTKNTFIHGHNAKGTHYFGHPAWNKGLTKEIDSRLGGGLKGKPRSQETIEKIRLKKIGSIQSEESNLKRSIALKGKKPWSYGLTKENNQILKVIGEKVSAAQRGKPKTAEQNRKIGEANKIALKKYYAENPETLERMSEIAKEGWRSNPNYQNSKNALLDAAQKRKDGLLPSGMLGKKQSRKFKDLARERMIEQWKDKKYAWKVMHRREMSEPEQYFLNFIKEVDLPYRFVGNFGIRIGRRYPDFIHLTKRKVIEVFGEFFHKGQDPQTKIDEYKSEGYECVVIWAKELHKMTCDELLIKIGERI